MLQSVEDAQAHMEAGPSLLGPGWREVASLEDLSDDEEYTSDEEVGPSQFLAWSKAEDALEELYAVLDLGQAIDRQTIQTESTYQLIGIDTPVPFLKFGNQIYQGEMAPLIGSEVILGLVRNPENPSQPSHPPLHIASQHISFRPITLYPKGELPPILGNQAKWGRGGGGGGGSGAGAAAAAVAAEAEAKKAAPRPVGRPKGATSRPKLYAESEEAVAKLDLTLLPENVIIELPALPDPDNPGMLLDPVQLSKHHAERLAVGLPAKGRGPYKTARTRAEPSKTKLADKVYLSQAGRRAQERERERERQGSGSGTTPDAEAISAGVEGAAAPTDDRPADFQLGNLTLTARDNTKPKPRLRKYVRKVPAMDQPDSGPRESADQDGDASDGETRESTTVPDGGHGAEEGDDVVMRDQGQEAGEDVPIPPASPLRELGPDE